MDEQTVIDHVTQRLAATNPELPATDVARVVEEAYALFDDSRIREFVALFVERRARVVLEQLEQNVATSSVETATAAVRR